MSDNEVAAANDRNMAKICAKISALMGVTWLLALTPFITGIDELWFGFIILNGSHGVFIFFLSGMPHHITQAIQNRVEREHSGNESRHTTSSM